MSNPFTITTTAPHRSAYNFEKDRQLNETELAVLKRKVQALLDALERVHRPDMAGLIRIAVENLRDMIQHLPSWNQATNRIEFVGMVNDAGLQNADIFGAEVATKAADALRYWEEHALPGKQV